MIKLEINYSRIQNQDRLSVTIQYDYDEFPRNSLPPFLKHIKNKSELVISTRFDFEDCPSEILLPFIEELYLKTTVQEELNRRGFHSIPAMLPEYLKCFYGGNDNTQDFNGLKTTPDYCHCGKRGSCPSEGFKGLCSYASIQGINISPVEIQLVQALSDDKIYKEMAAKRGTSFNTINTQLRKLRDKLRVLRSPALVKKFMSLGLLN